MSIKLRTHLLKTIASAAVVTAMTTGTAFSIVPNENQTSEDIVDTEGGVNGVGQFVANNGGGSIGLCTGTLINPRTVLFAAHCVNSRPEDAYGIGGVQASFGFAVDNLPAVINWFGSGFQTSAADFLYNINHINWHPDSVNDFFGAGFLEADVALATLDTPTRNIPTWAMLFSALPAPDTIDPVTGTGYHVNLTGYGGTGNAIQGPVEGIDFRRRLVENYLGALASLDEVDAPIFGPGFPATPQNLYMTDFDSQEDENGLRIGGFGFPDFNALRDDALPNEGTTAGGDSGGPLILDAANNDLSADDLILGVLSGGSRFFGAQPFSSLGTRSFYQPLYLFYDYIAANNAYKHVTVAEGDGDWEDASRWTSLIDPNYRIIDENGNVVVGIPDVQPDGVLGTEPDFGAVCTQNIFGAQGNNVCTDLSTGEVTPTTPSGDDVPPANPSSENLSGIGEANISDIFSGAAVADISEILADDVNLTFENGVQSSNAQLLTTAENQAQAPGDPNPAPTIANGLPGATNFTPNNVDPTLNGDGSINAAEYYDVTLSNAGTTTLSSSVEIDRLTVSNMAGLNIATNGSLNSLIDITHAGGTINVDGALSTPGDYFMMAGLLTGSGTITTPFFTNVMGTIVPGTMMDIDTLTIDGNAVLSSASGLMVNISSNGVNDVLAITGDSSLGGTVMFAADENVRFGNEYTFLTTAGTQTGELSAADISPILFADLVHEANSVKAVINARPFSEVVDTTNPVQSSYAQLLTQNRGEEGLAQMYATLDLATAESIQAIFDAWAPVTETTVQSMGKSALLGQSRFYRNRMSSFGSGDFGGTLTTAGRPVQLAALGQAGLESAMMASASADAAQTREMSGLDSSYALYLMGGLIDGTSSAMPTAANLGDEDLSGWNLYAGIEKIVSEHMIVGLGVSYTDIDADAALGQTATGSHFGGTLYGQIRSEDGMVGEAQIGVGRFSGETARVIGGNNLTTEDDNTTFSAEIGLSREYKTNGLIIAPGARVRHHFINFDEVVEAGGGPALNIRRDGIQSTQALLGVRMQTVNSDQIKLKFSGDFVKSFTDNSGDTFNAGFTNGSAGVVAPFAVFGEDSEWGEFGASVEYKASDMVDVILSVDTTAGRSDVDLQSYQGGIRVKF